MKNTAVNSDRTTVPAASFRRRIYHYHIRKTGGTSLNYIFFSLSGQPPQQVYARLNRQGRFIAGGIRYAGWQKNIIEAGGFDYAFSHLPMDDVRVPPDTFTVTILRDPAKRILSHYTMLQEMRVSNSDHPGFAQEAHLLQGGLPGFISNVPRAELLRQISMFSPQLDADEAFERIMGCGMVMLTETFAQDLKTLSEKTGLPLCYRHERRSRKVCDIDEHVRRTLREALEPEYRLLYKLRRMRSRTATLPLAGRAAGPRQSIIAEIRPGAASKARHPGTGDARNNTLSVQKLAARFAWLADIAAVRPRRKRQVVFVSDCPRSREAKLACGLRQHGWDVVLLHREQPTFDAGRFVSEAHAYSDPDEALLLSCMYNPVAYHVFSNWNYDVAEMLIRYRPGKVVFDDYDVMAGMVQDQRIREKHPGQLEKEKFCLENADGIACRSLETQYAKRHLGYNYRGKRILLLDCCWPEAYGHMQNKPVSETPVMMYCGNYAVDREEDGYLVDLARRAKQHKYSLHILLSDQQKTRMFREKILQQGLQAPHVVVHDTLPPEKLIYGMAHASYGLHMLDQKEPGVRDVFTAHKFRYASANKVFDYINAGLFVFIHHGAFMRFLLKRYGVGDHVEDPVQFVRNQARQLARIPKAFDIATNIPRLVNLYQGM